MLSNKEKTIKKSAERMKHLLKEYGHEVKHTHILEIMSKFHYNQSWFAVKQNAKSFNDVIKEKEIKFDVQNQVFLGFNESHQAIYQSFFDTPNALFVGDIGTGKSNALLTSYVSWYLGFEGNSLSFIVDPIQNGSDFKVLLGKDNVFLGKEMKSVIDYLFEELNQRVQEFAKHKVRNLLEYEKKMGTNINSIMMIFKEIDQCFALGLLDETHFDVEGTITYKFSKIIKLGRSLGIHIMASSREALIPQSILRGFGSIRVFKVKKKVSQSLLMSDVAFKLSHKDCGICYGKNGLIGFPFLSEEKLKTILKKEQSVQGKCFITYYEKQ